MFKRFVSIALAIVLIFVLSGAGTAVSSEKDLHSEPSAKVTEEKIFSAATLEDEFIDNRVVITLTHDASMKFKEYTLSDFPEIQCSRVVEITSNTKQIVKAKATNNVAALSANADDAKIRAINSVDENTYNQIVCLELKESGKENVLKAIKVLESRDDVLCAEPDYLVYPCAVTPNDPYYNLQWGITNAGINAAWDATTGAATVVVGVLDSGIDGEHPELASKINVSASRDFTSVNLGNPNKTVSEVTDGMGHGTHVAGIIAAQGNNGIGISGVAWNVTLVSLRVLEDTMQLNSAAAVAEAVDYAASTGIPILNLSLATSNSTSLRNAIAAYPGLVVCAAGNTGTNNDTNMVYPASWDLPNIISVGALTSSNTKADYSNYGSTSVDIFAPGSSILSTYSYFKCFQGDCDVPEEQNLHYCDEYHYMSGTSMAAPFVTGVAALIQSYYPHYTAAQIKAMILNNAQPVAALTGLCVTGGKLNAAFLTQHTHSYGLPQKYDEYYHTGYCSCGKPGELSPHVFKSGKCRLCNYNSSNQ